MESTNSQSLNKIVEAKDNNFTDQLNIVFQAFQKTPMTMKEADAYTGIMRENICWYVRTLLMEERIVFLRKRRCWITRIKWCQ